jgi:hypothetical protein
VLVVNVETSDEERQRRRVEVYDSSGQRRILCEGELIAFDAPFSQVLSLEPNLNAELSRALAGVRVAGGAP